MAFSLNRVTLIGNIGKDPETRFTTSNLAVTSFSVATQHGYKGKDGNWVNNTDWANVVAWSLSDFIRDNLKKGSKVYVEGRLTTRSYDDKEGNKRYVTEVIADTSKIILLDSKNDNPDFSQSDSGSLKPEVEDNDDLVF